MVTMTIFRLLYQRDSTAFAGTCYHARPQNLLHHPAVRCRLAATRTLAALHDGQAGLGPTRPLAAAVAPRSNPPSRRPDCGFDGTQRPQVGATLPGAGPAGPQRPAGTRAQARLFPPRWRRTSSRSPDNRLRTWSGL